MDADSYLQDRYARDGSERPAGGEQGGAVQGGRCTEGRWAKSFPLVNTSHDLCGVLTRLFGGSYLQWRHLIANEPEEKTMNATYNKTPETGLFDALFVVAVSAASFCVLVADVVAPVLA